MPRTGVKPTSEMVRQAVINITRPIINRSYFLDLFCGTGAVGIEALSNGADFCCFVEHSSKVYRLLRKNLETIVGDNSKYKSIKHNAVEFADGIPGVDTKFDIIFADPFYKDTAYEFDRLYHFVFSILDDDGVFILEHSSKNDFSKYASFDKLHKYGDTCLSVFRNNAEV